MELTELLIQWIQTTGVNLKIHVQETLIVWELNKNVQSYFGKEKMMKVRHLLLDQLVMIGLPVHAPQLSSFRTRI